MTKAENLIAHLKPESAEKGSLEAHPTLPIDPMKSAFDVGEAQEDKGQNGANEITIPPNAPSPPSMQLPDPSVANSDQESAPEKKWGLSSLLSRGRSDSIPSKLDKNAVSTAAAPASTATKGGWFSKGRSRHSSRASSADPVLSSPLPPNKPSDTPIVGGLPLIAGPLSGDDDETAAMYENGNGGSSSPGRGISVSAPVSTNITPIVDPLPLPSPNGIASGKEQKAASGSSSHRRHRSLLESLGWGKGTRSTASNASNSGDLDVLEDGGDKSNGVAAVQNDLSSNGGDGGGNNDKGARSALTDIELLEVELPPPVPFATRGMSNMGNSCFLNAALQCLRHTPGLPLILVPDLIEKAEERAKEQVEALAQATEVAAKAAEKAKEEAEATKAKEQQQEKEEKNDVEVAENQEEASSASKETVAALAKMGRRAITTTEVIPNSEDKVTVPYKIPNGAKNEVDTAPTEEETPAVATTEAPPAAPAPLPRPSQGELASSVAALFTELYLNPITTSSTTATIGTHPISPLTLLSVLRRFPTAADYFDGQQQDCQEVLQILLDLLHEDLKRQGKGSVKEEEPPPVDGVVPTEQQPVAEQLPPPPPPPPEKKKNENGVTSTVTAVRSASTDLPPRPPTPSTSPLVAALSLPPPTNQTTSKNNSNNAGDEALKADSAWSSWRRTAESPISDLFMGQLQSSVTCSKCGGRFTMYEPFWELSLPLAPSSGGAFSWLTFKPGSSSLTLQDCLRAYTAGEKLDGKEAFSCEKCGGKTPATKHLRLHRLPDALVLHVKRFKHGGAGGGGDKLTTDVVFPLRSLDLSNHLSPESPHPSQECLYDLYAISYHTGSLAGGHYLACCRLAGTTNTPTPTWYMFNDETVTPVAEGNVKTQNAYILFYARRKFKDSNAAAAVFATRDASMKQGAGNGHHHKRSASSGGSGSGGAGFLFGNRNKATGSSPAAAAASVAAVKEGSDSP
jgi:ubiquitin C-terminal hydrolase